MLSKEKSFVRNLKDEVSRLQGIIKEKERYLASLRDEKNNHVYQKETFKEKTLILEERIKKKEEHLLFVEKEMVELARTKNDLENEVELKSNAIRQRDKEIEEKERKIMEAIEDSNRLLIKIDKLKQQCNEDKEMSKKIEKLEDEMTEKENTIMDLRKNKTMTREEIKEELGNITKAQMALINETNEKINVLTDAVARALNLQENK